MAGDWLKIESGLPEKPEVWEIAMTLGVEPDLVVGKLIKVWRWFDAHTENGNAYSVTYSLLDSVAGLVGFAEAMSFVGWLQVKGKDTSLPNFERHNGKTAKNRALTAKRVAEHKAKNGNAKVTQTPLPREEKRREEKDQKKELPPSSPKGDKSKKGTRLPEGWQPSAELIVQVEAIGGPQLWRRELPKFVDYWIARPGAGGCKLDWPGTFRNWIRKAAEDSGRSRQSAPPKQSRQSAIFEILANDHRYANTASRVAGARHTPGLPAARAALPGLRSSTGDDPDDLDGLDEDFSD